MNFRSSRGVIPVWLVYVLAGALLTGGVVTAKKTGAIFGAEDTKKVKEQAAALVATEQRARDAEAEAARLRKAAEAAKAAADAMKDRRYGEVAANVSGVVYALEKEPDPSLNVQAGLALARSAQAIADPVAEARLKEMRELVDKLTAANEAIRRDAFAALAKKDADLQAAHLREIAQTREAAALKAEKDAAEANATTLASKLTAAVVEHAADAERVKTLGQKLASWFRWSVGTIALFFFACWILPLIAKAHPGLGWLDWLAKKAGATFAYGSHALLSAEANLAKSTAADAGKVLATLKAKTPEAAESIERLFDDKIRPEGWKLVAAGRAEAEKLLSNVTK